MNTDEIYFDTLNRCYPSPGATTLNCFICNIIPNRGGRSMRLPSKRAILKRCDEGVKGWDATWVIFQT